MKRLEAGEQIGGFRLYNQSTYYTTPTTPTTRPKRLKARRIEHYSVLGSLETVHPAETLTSLLSSQGNKKKSKCEMQN